LLIIYGDILEIKKRHDLSKSEVRKLFRNIKEFEEVSLDQKKGRYEICETDKDVALILFNGEPYFLQKGELLMPSLKLFLKNDVREINNRVIVDMGAIRYVTNGADIMRPGIVDIDEDIRPESFVVIGDEMHGKPLAIGISIYSGREILEKKSGKVIRNIHFVGDNIWNLEI